MRWPTIVALSAACRPEPAAAPAPAAPGVPADLDCSGRLVSEDDGDPEVDARALDQRVADHRDLVAFYAYDGDNDGLYESDTTNTYDDALRIVESVHQSSPYGDAPTVSRVTTTYGDDGTSVQELDDGDDGDVDMRQTSFTGPAGQVLLSDLENEPGPDYHYAYTFDAAGRVALVERAQDGAPFDTTAYVYDDATGPTVTACTDDGRGAPFCVRREYDADGNLVYVGQDTSRGGDYETEWVTEYDAGYAVHLEYSMYGDLVLAADTTWDVGLGLATEIVTTYPATGDVQTDVWTWDCR